MKARENIENLQVGINSKVINEGENLRRVRVALGYIQDYVADEAKMSRQNYGKYEKMEKLPEDKIKLFANILNVPVKLIQNLDAIIEQLTINFDNFQFGESVVPYIGNNTGSFTTQQSGEALQLIKEMHTQAINEKNEIIKELKERLSKYES